MIKLDISKTIIRLRREHSLDQKDLAKRSKISLQYINEIEKGKLIVKYVAKLAAVFGVSLRDIWHK